MTVEKPMVVTLGESMVLLQSMTDRRLKHESVLLKTMGGAESNLAISLSRLGIASRWISRLGEDPHGDYIYATIAGEGVDVSQVERDNNYPTAIYFKDFNGLGDPNVYYYRKNSAASFMGPEHVKKSWLHGATHLHVTGITPALGENTSKLTIELMKQAKANGMTVSFDPNLRLKLWNKEIAKEVLLSIIPLCDLFLPGIEESEFLLGNLSVEDAAKKFLHMGPQAVVVKLGEKGAQCFTNEGDCIVESQPVKHVVDTVGAGDAFASGVLSILVQEEVWSLELLQKAAVRGNLMGALAVQFKGDWEGAPTLQELISFEQGDKTYQR